MLSRNDIVSSSFLITGPSGIGGDSTSTKSINENSSTVHTFTATETVTWSLSSASITDTQNFFKSGEVKDGSGNIDLIIKTEDENSLLDVGGNEDGTKGFISYGIYSYNSSQDNFTKIDGAGLQTGIDFRGMINVISQNYIDEWNRTDSLRFDLTYINSAGTEYLDHYYLEKIDGVFIFSHTPTDERLLGSNDLNDASKFSINTSTGALTFNSAPDYESPNDSNSDNDYVVVVRATDSATNTSDQTLTVYVEDLNEISLKTYSGNFSDYKFYNKGDGKYEIKTDAGYDDITGYPLLTFSGEDSTSSFKDISAIVDIKGTFCLLYTSPSPRDQRGSRMPSSA